MLKRSSRKKSQKKSQLSESITEAAISSDVPMPTIDGKNAAAVALGRKGGLKGGKARAAKLSPERRSEIARKAAMARYQKEKKD